MYNSILHGRSSSELLPIGWTKISAHDVEGEHKRPDKLRSDGTLRQQAHQADSARVVMSHFFQRDSSVVALLAESQRRGMQFFRPGFDHPQGFPVHGQGHRVGHTVGMHS